MKVRINIKGVSNRQNKILHLLYTYPDTAMTLQEFLTETVKITVREYNSGKGSEEVLRLMSREEIDDQAATGKVVFGADYDDRKADEPQAVENALQCFADGMIAVFIDGRRYEELQEQAALKENSEVTFVRLTFLVGRMY